MTDWNEFLKAFLGIVFAGAGFLLLGTLAGGLVEAFVPGRLFARIMPRRQVWGVLLGGLMGLVLPMCECGIVVMLRRLMAKGLPLSCAVSYMLASPVVNVVVFSSTLLAFQAQHGLTMAWLRLGVGYLVAVTAGLWASRLKADDVVRPALAGTPRASLLQGGFVADPDELPRRSLSARLRHALHCTVTDFLDAAVYLVVGAAVAALLQTAVDQRVFQAVSAHPFLAIQLMMALAALLCLCSSSDAFVALSLQKFAGAPQLAMLTFGPVVDLKLVFLYMAVFRKKFILRLVLWVWFVVTVCSLAVWKGGWL